MAPTKGKANGCGNCWGKGNNVDANSDGGGSSGKDNCCSDVGSGCIDGECGGKGNGDGSEVVRPTGMSSNNFDNI